MKDLYIMRSKENCYHFDHGDDSASSEVEVTMRKTAMGWNIEVLTIDWDIETPTFLWVAGTAREAFHDCMHVLRFIERRRQILKRA